MYPTILCTEKCPKIRPQLYSTPQKPISSCQPQAGADRVAFISIAVRKLGNGQIQHIVASFTTILGLPSLLTVNNDSSAAASSPMNLQANHAPRVTPSIAHANCQNPNHIYMECVFQLNSHTCNESINPGHALSTHSIGDEPPALAVSGTTSSLR